MNDERRQKGGGPWTLGEEIHAESCTANSLVRPPETAAVRCGGRKGSLGLLVIRGRAHEPVVHSPKSHSVPVADRPLQMALGLSGCEQAAMAGQRRCSRQEWYGRGSSQQRTTVARSHYRHGCAGC